MNYLFLARVLSVGFVFAALFGIQNLSLSPDNRMLLSESDPRVVQLKNFEKSFDASNQIGFVILCGPNPTCKSALSSKIVELHELVSTMPFVVRVDSLANFPVVKSSNDVLETPSFFEAYCKPECGADVFSKQHSEFVYRYTNQLGDAMGVYAQLDFDASSPTAVVQIQEAANEIRDTIELQQGATIHYVGRAAMMFAFVEASINEVSGYMGIAIILIVTLLFLCFGNLLLALTSICLSLLTILVTLGLAGWAGVTLSTASATLPTVLLTLGTATSTHYFMHIVRVMTEDPNRDQREVAYGAVSYLLKPTLLTAGTTSATMLAMLLTDSPPLQVLGLWVAVGLPICCLFLFVLIPPVVARLPRIKAATWQTTIQPVLNQHAKFIAQRRTMGILALVFTLLAASNITFLDIDDDFVRYFGSDITFRKDTDAVVGRLPGPTNLEVLVDSGSVDGLFNSAFLIELAEFVESIRLLEGVQSVVSVVDILDLVAPNFSDLSWREMDDDSIAQQLFIYDLSLQEGQSGNEFVDLDNRTARISIIAGDLSSREIAALESQIRNASPKSSIVVTGEALPLAYLSTRNIPNIALSLLLTVLLTSFVLSLYFKSMRIGVVMFFSTVVPVIVGFGLWSLFESSIGLAAIIVLSITMGVVIDDAIHMVYRFNDGTKRLDLDRDGAASYAVHRVGNAIITTTIILAAGFGVLAFSDFEVNSMFGTCTALVLLSALLVDLLVLPNLLAARKTTTI